MRFVGGKLTRRERNYCGALASNGFLRFGTEQGSRRCELIVEVEFGRTAIFGYVLDIGGGLGGWRRLRHERKSEVVCGSL